MSSLCWRGLGAVGEDGTPRAALNLDRVRDLRPPPAPPRSRSDPRTAAPDTARAPRRCAARRSCSRALL